MRSWKATNGYGAAWTSLSPSDLHGTPVPMGTLPGCSAELAVPGQGRRAEGQTDPGEPPEQAFLSPVLCLHLSSGALPPGLPSEQHGNGLLGISPPPAVRVHVTHFVKSRCAPNQWERFQIRPL